MQHWHFITGVGIFFTMAVNAAQVGLITIEGAIGPATASYVSRAIDHASARHDECLILQLNTPGGLLASADDIKQSFYASRVPVVVFVSPTGAAATSAGTFITLAADIAAMAPHTRIGAAHPVGPTGEGDTNSVLWSKAENDTAADIKNIAEKRGRNAEWAVSAVRRSDSITSEEALRLNVIDLIAENLPDLLRQLDGREVGGKTLHTAQAGIAEIPRIASEKVFQRLWRPEVMMLLMLVAIYGIIGELSSPGAILPGVVGSIALLLVLYMAAILPVNLAGLALLGLAVALFAVDVFAPTHGILTAGGAVSFFLGLLMLFNRAGPGFGLSLQWILPATLLTALFFVFVVGKGVRAQFRPVQSGAETMIGQTVPALSRIDMQGGWVFIEGEQWNAVSAMPVQAGQPVEIIGREGLALKVKPKTD